MKYIVTKHLGHSKNIYYLSIFVTTFKEKGDGGTGKLKRKMGTAVVILQLL